MKEKIYSTTKGDIHYFVNDLKENRLTLVMLPGLTADHRLFESQVEYFKDDYNILVWDAPGHNTSRPFILDFDLFDKATWLHEILEKEKLDNVIIIGQSMGAYVGQTYLEKYHRSLKGFVSIDSAPLQRKYTTSIEIWLLERMEPIYKLYPWKTLVKQGSEGVAYSEQGIKLMKDMMETYSDNPSYYAKLVGHGYQMLASAYKKDLEYKIDCPAILICGEKDKAGSTRSYNKRWNKQTNIPLYWIKDAGHNSNTDKPDEINKIIESFVSNIK